MQKLEAEHCMLQRCQQPIWIMSEWRHNPIDANVQNHQLYPNVVLSNWLKWHPKLILFLIFYFSYSYLFEAYFYNFFIYICTTSKHAPYMKIKPMAHIQQGKI